MLLLVALTAAAAALASVEIVAAAGNANAGQNLIILLLDGQRKIFAYCAHNKLYLSTGYGAQTFNRTDPKLQQAFDTLIKNGVKAEHLKPVFPTQSYPVSSRKMVVKVDNI